MESSEETAIIRRKYKKEGKQFVGQPDYDEAEERSMRDFEKLESLRRKYE